MYLRGILKRGTPAVIIIDLKKVLAFKFNIKTVTFVLSSDVVQMDRTEYIDKKIAEFLGIEELLLNNYEKDLPK